ncbi:PA2779 family protein [Pseudohalioglobus sediminis]|uniref:PA2779 family protein n=1 Tax=Pseudohalioglobus sediminis TaxID=2606449 RepID=A0A5B0X1K2_9GAMM|nr:PA2779 family protein [Pseudohalioglobus sediminis]KAA1192528.1 PA2779 family protein [Pseudohalioglobus sediminis]
MVLMPFCYCSSCTIIFFLFSRGSYMSSIKKLTSVLLSVTMLLLSVQVSVARAEMIGTEQALQTQSLQLSQQALVDMFQREDVQAQLAAFGVDQEAAMTRVQAMTPAEVRQLNSQLGTLPAGSGSIVGLAVLVLLILVFLDIFGVTNIFTFINPAK